MGKLDIYPIYLKHIHVQFGYKKFIQNEHTKKCERGGIRNRYFFKIKNLHVWKNEANPNWFAPITHTAGEATNVPLFSHTHTLVELHENTSIKYHFPH